MFWEFRNLLKEIFLVLAIHPFPGWSMSLPSEGGALFCRMSSESLVTHRDEVAPRRDAVKAVSGMCRDEHAISRAIT